MGALTLSQGRLFGALYESILYGIQIVLLGCMLHLFSLRALTTASRVRCAVILVIFALSTAHLAAVMRGLQQAFFETTLSTDDFFNDRSQPMDLVQKAVYAVANALGDGLMIHRLYMIFENDWRAIVLPCSSLAATLALWGALIHNYSLSTPGQTLYNGPIITLAPAAFGMSFFTNVVITGMIVTRILVAVRRVRSAAPHVETSSNGFYGRVIAITVESGLFYPLVLLITGALLLTKDNGLEILSGSNMQVIGIVPIMMTLQLRLELSLYDALVRRARETELTLGTIRYNPGATSGETGSSGATQYNLDMEMNGQHAHIVSKPASAGGSWEGLNKEGSFGIAIVKD